MMGSKPASEMKANGEEMVRCWCVSAIMSNSGWTRRGIESRPS
jgi:hypothetical protein